MWVVEEIRQGKHHEASSMPARYTDERSRCRTATYSTYGAMLTRCTNPNQAGWKDYGGRGIKVCERWLSSFEAFYADMGERPLGMTLERIDVNGDYCPENCRWATKKEQCRNTRSNKFVEYRGERKTVAEWAEILGHDPVNLNRRLTRGWSVDLAMELPNGPSGVRPRLTKKQTAILGCLSDGPKRSCEMVTLTGLSRHQVDDATAAMKRKGMICYAPNGGYMKTGEFRYQPDLTVGPMADLQGFAEEAAN